MLADLPGFGKSDATDDFSAKAKKTIIPKFMDALGLDKAALIAHSSSGNAAVSIALEHPDRVSHVMILGTGSLLPPLEAGGTKVGGREGAAQARLEERMVKKEPTLADTRALLEANLFHHELITDEELQLAAREQHRPLLRRIRAPARGRRRRRRQAGGAAVAALRRAQDAAAADLRPRGPRPRRGTRRRC